MSWRNGQPLEDCKLAASLVAAAAMVAVVAGFALVIAAALVAS